MSGRLMSLRAAIGGQVNGNRGLFPGPGHGRKDRSLSLWDVGNRVVAHSFAGDSLPAIAEMLAANGVEMPTKAAPLTPDEARKLKAMQAAARAEEAAANVRKKACALALWDGAGPFGGLAADYLAGRGLPTIDPAAALRFAPAAPLKPYEPDGRTAPAMVALVTDPYGAAFGLHVTYLREGGRGQFLRIMLAPQAGGVVRLSQGADADNCLAIAEGIETALSYTALRGVPCWAARSSGGLEQFRPPEHVRRLIIAADGDAAGMAAAERLAALSRSFVRVEIDAAPDGMDWNDVLRGARHG